MKPLHFAAPRCEFFACFAVKFLTAKGAEIRKGFFATCFLLLAIAGKAQPNITAAEYFFNTDPGPGNGTAITIAPGTTIDLANINIPTTSLTIGWHTVCVRTRDANNVWGFYECRRIYIREDVVIDPIVPPADITQVEFFYNTDNGPGTGTSVAITSGQTIDLVNTDLANSLPLGWHTLHVRTKNSNNVWGFYESRKIFVRDVPEPCCTPPSPIVELEYFVDSDPGVGLSSTKRTINPSQPTIDLVDEPLDVGTQSLGAHKIYVRAKNEDGQWSMSEQANFTVITGCAIITAPSATGVSRCDPGSVTLTGSGADAGETYRWYATDTSVTPLFTGNPYNTASLAVTTTFYVTAYNPTTFCESVRTPVTASLDGIPKPALSISGSLAVCEGTTQVITAPAGFVSYTWSNGLTTQQITASATGSYSVVVNNGVCSSPPSDDFVFTVNPRPAKPVITGTGGGSLCGSGTVTLNAPVGQAAYLWSNGATTQSVDVTNVGSYTVIVSSAAGCQSVVSDPFTVTSTPPAKPTIAVTGNTTLCNGSTVDLSAPSGFTGYLWSTGATTQNITVNAAGSYTVAVSNFSCNSSTSDAVVVNNLSLPPQPSIQVTGSTALCNGAFTVLSAPAGFTSYLWSNGETSRQLVVSAAGDFTVQVGQAGHCLSVTSAVVSITTTGLPCPDGTVTLPPTPVTSNSSRCGNGMVSLVATGATAGLEYRWYDALSGGTELATTGSFDTPVLTQTTDYYVALFNPITSVAGNRAKATAVIVSLPKPVLQPSASVAICSGSSTLLTAPGGFATYRWLEGSSILSSTSQVLAVSGSGTYAVQTGDGTCFSEASDVVTVTVDPPLTKPVISGTTQLCGTTATTLTAPLGYQYLWSTNEVTASITVGAGNYTVTISDGTCSAVSDPLVVSVTQVPAPPTITPSGNTALCVGSFVGLAAPEGFAAYHWSNGESGRQLIVSEAGDYTVRVGNSPTCLSEPSAPISVSQTGQPCASAVVLTAPTVTNGTRCGIGPVLLSAAGAPAGIEYRWYNSLTSTTSLSSASSYEPVLTQTTDFYVALHEPVTASEGPRSKVTGSVVEVPAQPMVSVTGREFICSGSVVALTAPGGFLHYLWSNGETTQTILVETEGTYTVQVGLLTTCLSIPSSPIDVKLGTLAQCGVIPSPTNRAPVIAAHVFGVPIQGEAEHELLFLISDEDDNLDLTTLRIIDEPNRAGKPSGGRATLVDDRLLLTYRGVNFSGKENFTLQVCDLSGLCANQEITIDVVGEVQVYNGITPDGDGFNDFMLLQYVDILENARENKVVVLNRWGDVVFEIDNYNNTDRIFEGRTNDGQELPAGTYLYRIELAQGKTITGFLTLKR